MQVVLPLTFLLFLLDHLPFMQIHVRMCSCTALAATWVAGTLCYLMYSFAYFLATLETSMPRSRCSLDEHLSALVIRRSCT